VTIFERTSELTGNVNQMDLPVTVEELNEWQRSGDLIQRRFPNLTAAQREFVLNGSTPEEWDAMTYDEEDD